MIAYFDCFSGISGDMTLGAFIDLGVPIDWLKENINNIPLNDFELSVSNVFKNGISAKQVEVKTSASSVSRNYSQILSLLSNSSLSANIKDMSTSVFEIIATAEAQIHACPKEKVHFHELGGVDSIVDIVGTALCIDYLGITKVYSSKIPISSGFVNCQHGIIPVPPPAVLSILKDVAVYGVDIKKEIVTPTGAAIVKALCQSFGTFPDMIVEKTGYGAGKYDLEHIPNLLRITTGRDTAKEIYQKDVILQIETCIDDMNPEIFGFLMDRLFEDGALDVYWTPVYMKKNRPGTKIYVICSHHNKDVVINRILSETTTTGVRYHELERKKLSRHQVEMKTIYGIVSVKCITNTDGTKRFVPEYEVCKKIALEKNIPIKNVYENILKDLS
ncbi:MAG: nickel pincer cofactor biosynthesis protein LarC [Desulfobacterium sp.]|nr:nickel pincer cofactor biosynthesis protein LarC [Desulfobacterium sp.]MBU3950447.1 nickel pincer cofactor biosynthesis protein LarC [Pseudomonadota bacterium]MBU4037404.1 nickel pincer cofactor biosynthesis protein LarC [Pseudomonadota bacterium]